MAINITRFCDSGTGLAEDINNFRFTPFLGAGASSLRSADMDNAPEWKNVKFRIIDVINRLEKSGDKDKDDTLIFVRSLADARRFSVDGSNAIHHPEQSSPQELLDLLVALCRMTSYLITAACTDLNSNKKYLHFVTNKTIEFVSGDLELCNLMLGAIKSCEKIKDFSPTKSLFTDRIKDKLQYVACRLRMCECKAISPSDMKLFRCKSKIRCDYKNKDFVFQGQITMSEIDWFCELIWYVFRFDVPVYPTTRELTFFTSLQLDESSLEEIRCLDLAETVELMGSSTPHWNVTATLEKYFKHIEDQISELRPTILIERDRNPSNDDVDNSAPQELPGMLHANIALIAQHHFEKWQQQGVQHIPVILTTNYDRMVETELQQINCPYHVVYPIVETLDNSSIPNETNVQWYWLDGIISGNSFKEKNLVRCTDWDENKFKEKSRDINGPIVVKLHGSPMHPLFEKTGTKRPSHFVVLSASSYIVDIVTKSQPQWLLDMLGGNRSIWFLGCSLSDWNIRMLLFNHLKSTADSLETTKRVLFDRNVDLYKYAIMEKLGVSICTGELHDFSNRLPNLLKSLSQQGRTMR